ncbi:MAG: BBP7 family outer membrane beta-barrel protein [Planctomycetes bacterium]|nr:BBP7 family outer membrane beta-barrel protein [Planctomycetota bacterium]
MKRFRVKLIGFGCAVLAGTAVGADGPWQPAAQPTTAARVTPATTPESPAVAVQPVMPVPSVSLPAPTPAVSPSQPAWQPITPRVGLAMPEPRATIPAPTRTLPQPGGVESAAPAMTLPIPGADETPRFRSVQDQPEKMQQPTPPPREFFQPPKPLEMIPPELPGGPQQMLPQPTPLNQPTQPGDGELPVAPADLMVPAGATVPGQRGTFGSKPINISRDFPTFFADGFREKLNLRQPGGPAGYYGTNNRGFVQAEYLLWWASPLNIPLLGTTNTQGGFGFLGEPGTAPIIGPGQIISPFRNGFRVRAGTWLGEGSGCGIDGSFFYLAKKTNDIAFTSDQFGIITRPVFSPNPLPGGGVIGNTGEAVTVPGILTGGLTVHAESVIYGFDANIRKCLHTCCDSHAEWFFGYRNVDMQESVSITENINVIGVGAGRVSITDPIGSVVVVRDTFATNNYFNGAQIGGLYERNWGRFTVTGRGSVALGVTHQEVNIEGFQIRTQPGKAPMTFRGGLLAAGPNLGNFSRDEFSVVPELTVNMGYRVTSGVRLYAGYNLLYWSNVVRPGDQIDGVVDLSNVPNAPAVTPSGLARPTVPFRQSNMWISGVQFGAEFRW